MGTSAYATHQPVVAFDCLYQVTGRQYVVLADFILYELILLYHSIILSHKYLCKD